MKSSSNLILYILKRLLLMIPMIFLILVLTFVFSLQLSGDPTTKIFPLGTPEELIDHYRMLHGLDQPWYIQLQKYLINFFKGDLGISAVVAPNVPVSDYLRIVVPRTIELAIIPIFLVPIIGLKFGSIAATNQNKIKDNLVRLFSMAGVALPIFWVAMMFQFFFGNYLPTLTGGGFGLPTLGFKQSGLEDPIFVTGFRIIDCIIGNNQDLLIDSLKHMILPILMMCITSFSSVTRQHRASMLDVLENDYIRTARAKGCKEKVVINKHALRNALIPTSTVIIGQIAGTLCGSFFIELTFNYNGLGLAMINALFYRDYFLINGIIIITAFLVMFGNLIADIAYVLIDPRITY